MSLGGNPAHYIVRANNTSWREGIKQDAFLIIDKSRTPVDGSLVVAIDSGEFEVKRLRFFPTACLESIDNHNEVRLILGGELEGEEAEGSGK